MTTHSGGDVLKDITHRGIHDIAERIGESEDLTWRMLKAGRLPAFQNSPRGGWRMRESAYVEYLARIESVGLRETRKNPETREAV